MIERRNFCWVFFSNVVVVVVRGLNVTFSHQYKRRQQLPISTQQAVTPASRACILRMTNVVNLCNSGVGLVQSIICCYHHSLLGRK